MSRSQEPYDSLRAFRHPDRSRSGPGSRAIVVRRGVRRNPGAHAAELAALSSDFDAIWDKLENYAGRDGFAQFLRAHAHEPAAYYIAFRDETVSSIRLAIAARDARDNARDAGVVDQSSFGSRLFAGASATLARVIRAAPIVKDLMVTVPRHGFSDVYRGTLRILASLDRYPVFRLVNQLTRNRLPPRRSPFSSVAIDACAAPAPLVPGDEIPSDLRPGFREDVISQNQLTLVTVIAAGRVNRVRAVMSAIDSFAKRLAPPGSLIGISTIHFVRWLVIDDGRRLMMVSDYDGSWENYIDEFAEMILSGLDAIWETSLALPHGRRAGSACVQVLSAEPSGAGRSVLQRVSARNGSQYRERLTFTRLGARVMRRAPAPSCRRRAERHPGVHHQRVRTPGSRRVSLRPHRRTGRRPPVDWQTCLTRSPRLRPGRATTRARPSSRRLL